MQRSSSVPWGGILTASGLPTASVTRRLAEARGTFEKLQKVSRHAGLTRRRKIEIYKSCVVSKLLFSLEALCLRKAERDRVNSFHAQCLRKILDIEHSMFSRVANSEVLHAANEKPLSDTIDRMQLILYGRIASRCDNDLCRRFTLSPSSVRPITIWGVRARGRPRLTWSSINYSRIVALFNGDEQKLHNILLASINSFALWRHTIEEILNSDVPAGSL